MKKARSVYTKHLDVRSIIKVSKDVRLLLRLLMDHRQMALFKHQRARVIKLSTSSSDEASGLT